MTAPTGAVPHREGPQLPVACVAQRGIALKLPHLRWQAGGQCGANSRSVEWGKQGSAAFVARLRGAARKACRTVGTTCLGVVAMQQLQCAPRPTLRPPPHQPLAAAGDAALRAAGPEVAQKVGHHGAHLHKDAWNGRW